VRNKVKEARTEGKGSNKNTKPGWVLGNPSFSPVLATLTRKG
jgi:hypothetical protein